MKEQQPWRTFSIFISSTFADMQAERDYLKQIVFPRVEEELQQRRIKLQVVDLRWGVDTTSMQQEDEREATVLKVCLDEIKRCRPFFIGLLGDRYGWVPPEERIKNALVGEKTDILPKEKSVTALEIEFGVLSSKEQLSRSVFYFRDSLPYEKFSPERAAMYSDEYNAELNEAEKKERIDALIRLKKDILNHFKKKDLPEKVINYSARWDEKSEKVTGLEVWGERVKQDILEECQAHARDTWDQTPKNWQEQEEALLDAFIEGHTEVFCGRKALLEEIKSHLLKKEPENWGMVLTGESGSGKSAVFARVKKLMDEEPCYILAHSAGISPRAKNILDLLLLWNKRLSQKLGIDDKGEELQEEKEPLSFGREDFGKQIKKTPIEKIQERFRELLFTVAEESPIVLLIDALDRFEPTERAKFMTWLPTVIPGNIRMLCTAITETEMDAVQYHRGLFTKNIDYFTNAEARDMLHTLCKRESKTLPSRVETLLLEKKRDDKQAACSSPLWLSLAVNMLMALDHDDFEKMREIEGRGDVQIETYMMHLAENFSPEPGLLFLNQVEKTGEVFGKEFTATLFNYLAVSRNGLREKDLESLLPMEKIIWSPLQFTNLRRWFKAHLILQGEEMQWNLAHNILRGALFQAINETRQKEIHSNLADYLLPLGADPLKATEILYHLLLAGKIREAAIYYGGELTDDEEKGATIALAECIITDKKGLETVSLLPSLVTDKQDFFHGLLKRYIYNINESLEVHGHLEYRLILIQNLHGLVDTQVNSKKVQVEYAYDIASLYAELGDIYHSIGDTEKSFLFFNMNNRLMKKLYESDPLNESFKQSLASSYFQIGAFYLPTSQWNDAIKFYEKGLKLLEDLNKSDPQNEMYKKNLSISYRKIGGFHQMVGNMEEAFKYFELATRLSKELYNSNPSKEDLKENLAISYSSIGFLHGLFGQNEEAIKCLEKDLYLTKELYETNPKSVSIKNQLALAYLQIGMLYKSMNQFEEAHKNIILNNTIHEELYFANPRDESLKNHLAISYATLGDFHQAMDNFEEALKYYYLYNRHCKELNENNPLNLAFKNGLAISYEKLGNIHQSMGHMEEALNYFEQCSALGKELYESNPRSEELKNGLAISYERLGSIHQSMGHLVEALKYFEKDIELTKELYESNPRSESLKNGLAISYEKLGDIHQAMGHMEEALKYYEEYNRLGKELYESNPQNTDLLERLGISYYKLAMVYIGMNEDENGKNYFSQWKNILSHLAKKLPQVQKYQEWDKIVYEPLQNKKKSGYWLGQGDSNRLNGEIEKAKNCFEKEIVLTIELLTQDPENEFYLSNLAVSYDRLGDLQQSDNHSEEAKEYFKKSYDLNKKLIERNPKEINYKMNLSIALEKLGIFYQSQANFDLAIKYSNECKILCEEILKIQDQNNSIKVRLSNLYLRLGDVNQAIDEIDLALKFFIKYDSLIKKLIEDDPQNESYKIGLAMSGIKLGGIYLDVNKSKEAIRYINDAEVLFEELIRNNPQNDNLKINFAPPYLNLGVRYHVHGNFNQALKFYEMSNILFKELSESHPDNLQIFESLGVSYYYLAMIYKDMDEYQTGIEYFGQWKNLISDLAQKIPQIKDKYSEMGMMEYD